MAVPVMVLSVTVRSQASAHVAPGSKWSVHVFSCGLWALILSGECAELVRYTSGDFLPMLAAARAQQLRACVDAYVAETHRSDVCDPDAVASLACAVAFVE